MTGVVGKIYSQIRLIKEIETWIPVNDAGSTRGYCFIDLNTPQEAPIAKNMTHGYKLDSAHTFVVNLCHDICRFLRAPDKWAPPKIEPYRPGNLHHWLTGEKGRDQFLIRARANTKILWNDAGQAKADIVYKRPYWTESFMQWSPLGTYLATVNR